MCVAKKALAQALQAERDVASVDTAAIRDRRRTAVLQEWEHKHHSDLSDAMNRDFGAISDGLDRERRRIGDIERRTDSGDREIGLEADVASRRQKTDLGGLRQRILNLAEQATLVSQMYGPPGPQGPPVRSASAAPVLVTVLVTCVANIVLEGNSRGPFRYQPFFLKIFFLIFFFINPF